MGDNRVDWSRVLTYCLAGGRQPVPAELAQGLALLQGVRGQGWHLGDTPGRARRVPAQPQSDSAQVGLPRAYLRPWRAAQGAESLQARRRRLPVIAIICALDTFFSFNEHV